MKNKTVKRIISMLLCALIALSTPLGVMAVELNSAPVIYVGETADNALYFNPNKSDSSVAFDMGSTDFTGDMTNIVAGLLLASIEGVDAGKSSVITGITGMMENILCNEDGTSKQNVGPWEYTKPVSAYKNDVIYTENIQSLAKAAAGYVSEDEIFFFSYDWRLDPTAAADDLKEFIEHVESVTGKKKVALLATGNGGIVVNSYLCEYEAHAADNVSSAVFYNCSLLGNSVIGDFMRGRIARTNQDNDNIFDTVKEIDGTTRGDAFFAYLSEDSTGLIDSVFTNLLGDDSITSLFGKVFTLFVQMILESQDVHKTLGQSYNNLALGTDDEIYDNYLRGYLRNMPGLWAMVPQKDFVEAIEFMFEGDFINTELSSQIYAYREVQSKTSQTLSVAKNNGINVCVVSNYGYQLLPATVSLFDMSDSFESVKYSSAGAVTTDNATEAGHLISCLNSNHNHTSPEGDINAAYCVLPENTWFIKGVTHADMSTEPVATFLVWLLFGFNQRNIRENASYTQYMEYSAYSKKLVSNTVAGEENAGAQYGDVDYDGDVDAADARTVLRISVGLEAASKETMLIADVDGTGAVEAADARFVLRYAVGLEKAFPAE